MPIIQLVESNYHVSAGIFPRTQILLSENQGTNIKSSDIWIYQYLPFTPKISFKDLLYPQILVWFFSSPSWRLMWFGQIIWVSFQVHIPGIQVHQHQNRVALGRKRKIINSKEPETQEGFGWNATLAFKRPKLCRVWRVLEQTNSNVASI